LFRSRTPEYGNIPLRANHAENRFDRRAFARAVPADQPDHLPFFRRKTNFV
jgi:hypothetical protein